MSLSFAPAILNPTYQSRVPPAGLEVEVITLLVEGHKDEQIGARLGISIQEVRDIIESVYQLLGVSDRLGLIIHAFYYGIVPPAS